MYIYIYIYIYRIFFRKEKKINPPLSVRGGGGCTVKSTGSQPNGQICRIYEHRLLYFYLSLHYREVYMDFIIVCYALYFILCNLCKWYCNGKTPILMIKFCYKIYS